MNEWDERFMTLAHHIAGWSTERGRRVGAVIVDSDKDVLSIGFNRFPRGVNENIEDRHSRVSGAKYIWSSHAERNAIYHAARIGISLKGAIIYIPWFPCIECAKAIIESGISEVVAYMPDLNDHRWGSDFKVVTIMLKEAKVDVRFIEPVGKLMGDSA